MIRLVPASVIAEQFLVSRQAVTKWAQRGKVTKHPGGLYDPLEVAAWLLHRKEQMIRGKKAA